MNTESQQQVAREAALELYGTSHGTGQLDRPIAIILSAIERATEAKDKEMDLLRRVRRNVEHNASHQAGAASRELLKEIDATLAKIKQ